MIEQTTPMKAALTKYGNIEHSEALLWFYLFYCVIGRQSEFASEAQLRR